MVSVSWEKIASYTSRKKKKSQGFMPFACYFSFELCTLFGKLPKRIYVLSKIFPLFGWHGSWAIINLLKAINLLIMGPKCHFWENIPYKYSIMERDR